LDLIEAFILTDANRSVRLNVSLLGHKIKEIKPLPEEQALSQGAEFVCEFFVYSVAAATVIAEVIRNNRKSEKESMKKKARQDEKHRLMKENIDSITAKIEKTHQELLGEIQFLQEENQHLKSDMELLKERSQSSWFTTRGFSL